MGKKEMFTKEMLKVKSYRMEFDFLAKEIIQTYKTYEELRFELNSILPLTITNPFEKSIRYDLIRSIECFYKVSNSTKRVFYPKFPTYEDMNNHLLTVEQAQFIEKIQRKRNFLAHKFDSNNLEIIEDEMKEITFYLIHIREIIDILISKIEKRISTYK